MEYKYLSSIPKPLLKDFVNNRVIPIIGAGFSKNAELPANLSMPDWKELGRIAASEIPDYTYDNDAIDALSYYEVLYSRVKLVELLMKELHFGKIQPNNTHKSFCELFTGTICTTNFDSLIEDTMTQLHRPVSVVVTKDRLTIGYNDESRIVKLHGDFNHPERMVITERDFDVYLDKNPIFATYIANLFITNTMLLIGYSLDDNDFRCLWQIINSRLGNLSQPAYCLTVGASPESIAKYKRRNIRVINLNGSKENYKTILCDFFTEMKDYLDNEKDKRIKSTDERINEQMIIPAEDNKLCFLSCAMSRIAQLSDLIYPILGELGITPIRIDDMLMPDDNWVDVSRAAIRKSKAAIVDLSKASPNVRLEFEIIKSMKNAENILLLCDKGRELPVSLTKQDVVFYTYDVSDEVVNKAFINKFKKWCCTTYGCDILDNKISSKQKYFSEAYRLFEKGEYSACIVSAYSELEYIIRSKDINKKYQITTRKMLSLREYYFEGQKKSDSEIYKIIELRNKIVHDRYQVSKKEASDFLKFVEKAKEDMF